MGETAFVRFGVDRGKSIDLWSRSELQPILLPHTAENLKRAGAALNVFCGHIQNLVYFEHNQFDIHALAESLPPSSPKAIARLTSDEAKHIFLQAMAVAETAEDLGIDFIDFTDIRIAPDRTVRFPLCLTPPKRHPVSLLAGTFGRIPHLKEINENNCRTIFRRERGTLPFNEKVSHLFKFDTFSSHLLNSYSLTGMENETAIKIKITTKQDRQKAVIRNNLYRILRADDVRIARIDLKETTLEQFLKEALIPGNDGKRGAGEILQEFKRFQKKSIFRKTIFFIENLENSQTVDFLRIFLNSHEIPDVIVVAFTADERLEYDLELREDPPNLMQKALPFESLPKGVLPPEEIEILNLFRIANSPVAVDALPRLFPARLLPKIDHLIRQKRLFVDSCQRTISLGTRLAEPKIGRKKKLQILKSLAENAGMVHARIRYFAESGKKTDLEIFLRQYARGVHRESQFGPVRDALVECVSLFRNHPSLLELGIDIFLKAHAVQNAKEWLLKHLAAPSSFRHLKLAHIGKIEKNYQQMKTNLDEIDCPPSELQDEWFHLKFFYHEKFSDRKNADRFLGRISGDFYRHLSLMLLCDRHIYRGDFLRAEKILRSAGRFFSRHGYAQEAIEVQSQMGKLMREKGEFRNAERLYQDIFIQSELMGFHLLSAYISVDLGNLYLEHDDDLQAESWYRKAQKSFAREEHPDGEMLVKSNLSEVFVRKGDWKEAETLLKTVLKYNEEKEHVLSTAIDCFNLAYLEFLRQNWAKSLKTCGKSLLLFRQARNTKGILECAFLKNKIRFMLGEPPDFSDADRKSFNPDQRFAYSVLGGARGIESPEDALRRIRRAMDPQISPRQKFEVLALLTQKLHCPDFLESLKTLSIELAKTTRDYFYHEYFFVKFGLHENASELTPEAQETFLDTFDFFSINKRKIGANMAKLKGQMEEDVSRSDLFDSARRVEQYSNWKIPEDFFRSFAGEINRNGQIKLIRMAVFEVQEKIFDFTTDHRFRELGDEIIKSARQTEQNFTLPLPELQARFASRERVFYPYALTQVVHWKMGDRIHACLILAFCDRRFSHVDFFQRNRDTFNTFAALFRKFYEVDLQIGGKLDFIVGQSRSIRRLKETIAKVARVDFSLLITGESGSGKELVAKAVHLLGPRAGNPFVSVNSAAIPEHLLEAELFGFRKGAFTGATEARTGLIESADRGTLFLDEIADLPPNLQAKLLRVLQENEIRRLGENKNVRVDIRLISATNQNLRELIRANRFREDLYYRLQDIVIAVPPLRERSEDIPLLARHFLAKYGHPCGAGSRMEEIIEQFRHEPFAGNVRELESRIKSLITFDSDLGTDVAAETSPTDLKRAKEAFEKAYILRSLEENQWNRTETARRLGISRMGLFNLIQKFDIREHENVHR